MRSAYSFSRKLDQMLTELGLNAESIQSGSAIKLWQLPEIPASDFSEVSAEQFNPQPKSGS